VRSRSVLTVIVILGVVVLLNLPPALSRRVKAGAADNLSPFQSAVAFLQHRVRRAPESGEAGMAALNRAALLEEIASLREAVRRGDGLREENARLRRLLGFQRAQSHRLVLGEVIARGDTTGWWQTVRINRGTRDGVQPNRAVMSLDGLVGRTTAVSRYTADVLLLTDLNSRIACKAPRTGAMGIVVGAGVKPGGAERMEILLAPEPCRMEYVSKDAALDHGDVVVTSGLGGVYPEGLPVGRIAETELDKSRLFQRATVVPAARLDALRYLFVVVE
jgi:rod shape-determining protein MreC